VIAYVTSGRETTLEQYAVARLGRLYSVAIPAILLTLICDKIGLMSSSQWYAGRSYFNPDTSYTDIIRYLLFNNEYWSSHVVVGSDEPYWSIGFEASYYALYAAIAFPSRNRFVSLATPVLLLVIFGPKITAYLPLWLIGVAVFLLIRNGSAQMKRLSSLGWWLVLVVTVGLYAGLRAVAHYHPAWKSNMFEPFFFSRLYLMQVTYFTSVGLLVAASIIAVANLAGPFSVVARVAGKQIRWLAGATFTLYLLHQPILLMLVSVFPGDPATLGRALAIQIATLVAVLCIAEITERRKAFWTSLISAVFYMVRRGVDGVAAWPRRS
jgi:peptidoglycan/LPS O-acetylase OafA/YrhL